jgi:hypothetical protein
MGSARICVTANSHALDTLMGTYTALVAVVAGSVAGPSNVWVYRRDDLLVSALVLKSLTNE